MVCYSIFCCYIKDPFHFPVLIVDSFIIISTIDIKPASGQPCYHHSIKEPTKVVELEPQEQNIWNTKVTSKNDNIFYSKYLRNKASSDSSVDQLRNETSTEYPMQNVRDQNIHFSTSQNTFSDMKVIDILYSPGKHTLSKKGFIISI